MSSLRWVGWMVGASVVATLAGPSAASAQQVVTNRGCLENACGPQNCTANDADVVVVGLGVQDDGCVSTTDTTSIYLGAYFGEPNAQSRYDVAIWVSTDTDPNQDGALTGSCATAILSNLTTPPSATSSCPPLDLTTGGGLFPNTDGDLCGEIFATGDCNQVDNFTRLPPADGLYDQTFVVFENPVTFQCGDNNPTDGFVDFNVCASWSQRDNENLNCTVDNACPGTAAKCGCQIGVASNVPFPDPTLTCSCAGSTGGTIDPGQGAVCSVTLANADNINCDAPASTLAQYLRCGVLANYQVRVDYDETEGCVPDVADALGGTCDRLIGIPHDPANFPADLITSTAFSGNGTFADNGTSGVLAWNFRNDENFIAADGITDLETIGDNLNLLGEGQSRTMTFVYQTSETSTPGTYNFPVTLHYDNPGIAGLLFSDTAQPLTVTCSVTLSNAPNWAAVTGVRAHRERDGVVVEWETAAEIGSLSFDLLRLDPATGAATQVNRKPLPASRSAAGASYRFRDEGAFSENLLSYAIVERDQSGRMRSHGPFQVEVEASALVPRRATETRFETEAHAPSARMAALSRGRGPMAAPVEEARSFAAGSAGALKVGVERAGLYSLSESDLATGLGSSVNEVRSNLKAGRFSVTNRGQAVAWFASSGRLFFWGEPSGSNYARENVYWVRSGSGLLVASQPGSRPRAVAPGSFTDTVHSEEESFASPFAAADAAEDYVFWQNLAAGYPGYDRKSFAVQAPGLDGASSAATMRIELVGFSASHQIEVGLGGSVAGQASWTGTGRRTIEVEIPFGHLVAGTNQVELHAVAGELFVDSIDLVYQRSRRAVDDALVVRGEGQPVVTVAGFSNPDVVVLDLSDPAQPKKLPATVELGGDAAYRVSFRPLSADARTLVATLASAAPPASLRADEPSNLLQELGAEYVVVAGAGLESAAADLAALRASEGLSTMVVALEDVYDEFSDGLVDPGAIRAFFRHAALEWSQPIRFGVLAGKGSWDIRDVLGAPGNLVPPLMTPVSPGGLLAADALYGDVDGDERPDLAIGRLPVTSAAELTTLVQKLASYGSESGEWSSTGLFVADNPDAEGSYHAASEVLASAVPAGFTTAKVYLPAGATTAQIEATRAGVRAGLDAGALVLGYFGHGGFDRLAHESLLTAAEVPDLANGARLPLVTALTCNINMFGLPGYSSLGEELVVAPGGGAVGVISNAALSAHDSAESLANRLYARLFGAAAETVGEALSGALRESLAAGPSRDLLLGYNLLGDPAQRLR